MDKKLIIKYFLQFVVIVLVGAGIFFGVGYYRYRTSPEYRQYQDLLAQKERYMADTYGGDTPEETLELFISALKAGDILYSNLGTSLDSYTASNGAPMDQLSI